MEIVLIYQQILPIRLIFQIGTFFQETLHLDEVEVRVFPLFLRDLTTKVTNFRQHLCEFR